MRGSYRFRFCGSRQELLNKLAALSDGSGGSCRFSGYIVEYEDGRFRFGIERGGHSGGYWYVPETVENGGCLEFDGKIRYIDDNAESSGLSKVLLSAEEAALTVVLLPITAVMKVWELASNLMKRIRKIPREPSEKEKLQMKLRDLMVTHLDCEEL